MSFFSALLSDGSSNVMSQDSCYQVDDNAMQPTYSGDVEFQNDDSMSLQNANTGPIGKLLLYLFVKGHDREILTIGIVLYYFIGSCSFIFFRNYTQRRRFYVTSELKRETIQVSGSSGVPLHSLYFSERTMHLWTISLTVLTSLLGDHHHEVTEVAKISWWSWFESFNGHMTNLGKSYLEHSRFFNS